jgi:hypothetical protein
MPSRKKAKGKARRAAKAAEEEAKDMVAVTSYDGGSLETQMQRLTIDDLLECRHGCNLKSHDREFCREFVSVFSIGYANRRAGEVDVQSCFSAGWDAAEAEDKFSDVWDDDDASYKKLKDIVSYLVTSGAQHIIEGKDAFARIDGLLCLLL